MWVGRKILFSYVFELHVQTHITEPRCVVIEYTQFVMSTIYNDIFCLCFPDFSAFFEHIFQMLLPKIDKKATTISEHAQNWFFFRFLDQQFWIPT